MPFPVIARRLGALFFAALLGAGLAATVARAQSPAPAPRAAVYLILKGADTIIIERVRRNGAAVSAVIAQPNQPSVELNYVLAPDHSIPEAGIIVRGANATADTPPLQSGVLRFRGDSAALDLTSGGATRNLRIATKRGALPITNNDFVIVEQAARMAKARNVRTLTIPVFAASGGVTLDATFERLGGDTARFTVMQNVTEVTLDAEGNITGGSIPSAGMRVVAVIGAASESITLGKPDYGAPAGAPYTANEVSVRTPAGHRLTGTLTLPKGASGRLPAIVTITGSGQQDRDEYIPIAGGVRIFRQLADTLSRRGIAVLRLDDRGVGGSGGDVLGTSADFADDIRAGIAFLRARAEIDPDRIALVGHSEGGTIAPMIAKDDPKVAALVLMAGTAFTGREIIDYQIRNGITADPRIAPARRDSAARAQIAEFDATAGKTPWMRYFLAYAPVPTACAVKQPTLIVQGATDQQVRPIEASMLQNAMIAGGNTQVTLRLFPERNHMFLRDADGHPAGYAKLTNGRLDGEVLGTIADWLATTLRAR